ncbi:rhomboid family intramembrane serine protease [Natrinema halophilum]|uniref:Rhomboid family intramembrane serine protease n=1 Tax=Natrinema halophilum TaxID=1699371 RepID=A0A7D5K682_9EURY|nr:rhomboid family intramembrane serine protease [Natrinema halophilum]QLG49023.1 rhomboid family intramembrane serine protease [Natrinema halophilum]
MAKGSRSRSQSDSYLRPGSDGDDEPTSGAGSPILELLVVFALVFVLQGVAYFAGLMGGLFVLAPPLVTNPWTIVTSVYAHSSFGHLLSNSIALVVFGWPVARATTRMRFHAFFVATGAIAGVSQIVVTAAVASVIAALPSMLTEQLPWVSVLSIQPTAGVLGASGAVFALLGYLVASNRLSTGLASFVTVPRWVSVLAFVGLALGLTFATASPGVALIAHFTGFLVGLLAGRTRLLAVSARDNNGRSPI